MNPPIEYTFTRDKLTDHAKAWMVKNYGRPMDSPDIDRWHERLGMLYDFLTEITSEDDKK